MIQALGLEGAVYVLENAEAQRVKVGMTAIGVNDVGDRLRDINDMWLGRKVTCQICGRRCVSVAGRVPHHIGVGSACAGGNARPLEEDVSLARAYLADMTTRVVTLSGTAKGSMTKQIRTLAERIERFHGHEQRVGTWSFSVAYYTKRVAEVELLSHTLLEEYRDRRALLGEVFCCSAAVATGAVESALKQLGMLEFARRREAL